MADEALVGYSLDGSKEGGGLSGSLLGKYYMSIRLGPYKRPEPFAEGTFETKKTIVLPLPQELRDDTSVSYENVNLESVGDLINTDFSSGVGSALLRNSGKMIEGAIGFAGNQIAGETGSAVAEGISSVFPADQITSAIQQSIGTAPNPNPSVQFTGPDLRSFAWTWTLLAANSTESDKIRKLVAVLKAASLPRTVIQNEGGLLAYPDMCQLNFYPWDMKPASPWTEWGWGENSIIKIKKCMISYVNALYTPSNTPAFFGGGANSPVAVQLSIGFKELEYFVSEDWGGDQANYTNSDIVKAGVGAFGRFAGGPAGELTATAAYTLAETTTKSLFPEDETAKAVKEEQGS